MNVFVSVICCTLSEDMLKFRPGFPTANVHPRVSMEIIGPPGEKHYLEAVWKEL